MAGDYMLATQTKNWGAEKIERSRVQCEPINPPFRLSHLL